MAGILGAFTALRSAVLGCTAALGRIALVVAVSGVAVVGVAVLGLAVLGPVVSDAGGGVAAAGSVSVWGVVGGVFWLGKTTWAGEAVQGDGDLDVDVDACWEGEVSGV